MNKIKRIEIGKMLIFSLLLLCSCIDSKSTKNDLKDSNKDNSISTEQTEPFIGKRRFETRPGISGTGTPYRQIEIKNNGDVEFSFEQVTQADKIITKGLYNAGRFTNVMKCVFKEWEHEVRFYKIMADKIYEVDSNGILLNLDECCPELAKKDCPCESEYISF